MKDQELNEAVEPLKRFLFRNKNLTGDEKIEAYGMLLDCVINVVKSTNGKNIEEVKRIMVIKK